MLLNDAIRDHLHSLVFEGRSPHTVRNARSVLRELAAFLGTLGIHGVEDMGLDALMQFRHALCTRPTAMGTPLAVGSQREHVGKLRGFCRWLFEQGLINVDLAARIPKPRRTRRLPKPIMDLGEVDRILASTDLKTPGGYRDRAILEVLYSTAIRREEAATLVLNDVDTVGGYLTVRNGKNGKDRVVPMGETACRVLNGFIDHIRPRWPGAGLTERLFLTRFGLGMQPAAIWHVVRKYARAARIRKSVSTHTFRHTCATQMARAGVPIRHLQELLGHESIETTQVYTHLAITDLKAAHRRFHPRERHPAFRLLPLPPD